MVGFVFDNSYARLPDRFFSRIGTSPVVAPSLIALNAPLAQELGLNPEHLSSPAGLAVLSGSAIPEGAAPIAQAYAGHQFGGFSPQLGDGRAMLLGEVIDRHGQRQDIQLKGSGRTPYSRNGDGRAWLGPVLREYLVSEAMHALGIPTTRALAAVATGQKVQRETALPGAVLTRIASSHIRIGSFEYFAARRDLEALKTLTDYTLARHFPALRDSENQALALLAATAGAQAKLIARWLGVGFIHGVMNTDNSHVAGLTIDYGPCAFMDAYHPMQVYSAIDRQGRYAYGRQPEIMAWNLAQFASALIPLMGADQADAVRAASQVLQEFPEQYHQAWLAEFRAKLGLLKEQAEDEALIHDLLQIMAVEKADFTNTFRSLGGEAAVDNFQNPAVFLEWQQRWQARVQTQDPEQTRARITSHSPVIIPRNHRIEQAITAAVAGDLDPFERLHAALASPYAPDAQYDDLRLAPEPEEIVHRTFCGT